MKVAGALSFHRPPGIFAGAALLLVCLFAASPSSAQQYALSVSTMSNHSSALALQGAGLSGNAYIFTSSASNLQNFDPTGISRVCYWLDNASMTGTATHCESFMPYDFAGSTSNTTTALANPWNTAAVSNGTHSITQLVTKSAGGTETDTSTFTVQNAAPPSGYALSVSANSNHSNGIALQGAALAGNEYVFTSFASNLQNFSPTGISKVCYWLDNPSMVGTATHCESAVPYDFAGSASTTMALPWNTAAIANGPHSITQLVTKSAGGSEVDTATFAIQNLGATLLASPPTVGPGQSSQLNWTSSGATSVSIDQGIGTVASSGTLTVTPSATTTYTLTATGPSSSVHVSATVTVDTSSVQHYFYVMPDQAIYVYDIDDNFQLVKTISLPQLRAIRGGQVAINSHMLYISFGGSGGTTGNGSLLKYDLLYDTVVWTQSYPFGVDSFSITPDGATIYMPDGEHATDSFWYVIDAATGNVTGSINSGAVAPHNTIISLDGADVFMASQGSNYLVEASTATNQVVRNIGPLKLGVRPFTINGKHTLALTTATGFLGFQVSDITTGALLYTVPVPGFSSGTDPEPSHGISLSPDEKEIYLIDRPNNAVHVFDVSGLPSQAPTLAASIALTTIFSAGNETPCVYDCPREGWLLHSLDGHFVFVGDSGDVIDTSTRQVIGTLPELINTRHGQLEIDWQNGLPISTTTHYGLGHVTQ